MVSTGQNPQDEPLDDLETETVQDLDVEEDADQVVGGNDDTRNFRCVITN